MYQKKESVNLEWKENSKSTYLKTVSAFANYLDGEIIFGIEDKDGEIIGIANTDQEKLAIENAINDGIQPRPRYILKVEHIKGKDVIILKVFKGKKPPYMHKNRTYQRQDTSTVPVDEVAFQQLYLEGSNLTFDELEADVEYLEFSTLERALQEKIGIEELTEDLLRTMGLFRGDSYTNAGMLLADQSSFKYGIDIVRFGQTDSIFIERQEVKGKSILDQYQVAMDMFDRWYAPYEEVVGFYRQSRLQIPREAFREAVANAIIHRDYVLKANIRIAMRENSIEIISPGGLPTGISKEAYVKGLYAQIRNDTLAEVFRRLQIIEKYGTGIKRIRETYQQFKQTPEFDVIEGLAIQVILPRLTYADTQKEENNYEYQVLQFVNEKVETTRVEIQNIIGGSEATLKRVLQKLVAEGKIQRKGKSRATKYQSCL